MDEASVGAHSCAPLPADRASPAPPAIADFACQISLAGGIIDPLPHCSVLKASSALLSFRRKWGLLSLVKRLFVTRLTRLLTRSCLFRYSTAGKSRPVGKLFLWLVPRHLIPS